MSDLTLVADSIAVVPAGYNCGEVIIFNPSKETLDLLTKFQRGDNSTIVYSKAVMIDKWDDGADDTHVSQKSIKVLRCTHSALKKHTWLLTVQMF